VRLPTIALGSPPSLSWFFSRQVFEAAARHFVPVA
jgi:hypothetical protein